MDCFELSDSDPISAYAEAPIDSYVEEEEAMVMVTDSQLVASEALDLTDSQILSVFDEDDCPQADGIDNGMDNGMADGVEDELMEP